MSTEDERIDKVINALRHALDGDSLPERARGRAQGMLDALVDPVRVSVIGPPDTGKTTIVNLLAGEEIVPRSLTLGVTKLVHGPFSRAIITMRDGGKHIVDDPRTLSQLARNDPAMTQLQAPLKSLRTISLTELSLPPGNQARRKALEWISSQTDFTIWCTQSFDDGERLAWGSAPDRMRDASLLLRTRADQIDASSDLALSRLEAVARGHFNDVQLISAYLARVARGQKPLNRKVFRRSGAAALMTRLMTFVERRREGIADQAQFLLAHHALPIVMDAPPAKDEPEDEAPKRDPKDGPTVMRIDSRDIAMRQVKGSKAAANGSARQIDKIAD
ncbi:MAG: hypothetical protein AAF390_13955, partial [Pseudomonadota bacterium]